MCPASSPPPLYHPFSAIRNPLFPICRGVKFRIDLMIPSSPCLFLLLLPFLVPPRAPQSEIQSYPYRSLVIGKYLARIYITINYRIWFNNCGEFDMSWSSFLFHWLRGIFWGKDQGLNSKVEDCHRVPLKGFFNE